MRNCSRLYLPLHPRQISGDPPDVPAFRELFGRQNLSVTPPLLSHTPALSHQLSHTSVSSPEFLVFESTTPPTTSQQRPYQQRWASVPLKPASSCWYLAGRRICSEREKCESWKDRGSARAQTHQVVCVVSFRATQDAGMHAVQVSMQFSVAI